MAEAKLDQSKLRGIGTDGASTKKNGWLHALRTLSSAISVHCAAHRLNLASSQASNSVPRVKNFVSFVSSLIFSTIVQLELLD
jgi:hypothetical protein